MAQAQTLRFGQFLIKIGNGANPEVFVAPCGANTKSFNRTMNMNDTNIPDCNDPDLPSWLGRDVVSNSAEITFEGVVDDGDFDMWDLWVNSGAQKNIQVSLGGTRIWQFPARISQFNITGERGQRVTFEATIVSDGEVDRIL